MPKRISSREVFSSKVREDPAEAATSSAASIDNGDSLLRQVEDYADVSASTFQQEGPILIDKGLVGQGYGVLPTGELSGMVIDVNPSKIKLKAAMAAFSDAKIDAHHFYFLVPMPNNRAHNSPPGHMIVFTQSLTLGQTIPFHPFVKVLCGLHRNSLVQLSPNCWVTINFMIIL